MFRIKREAMTTRRSLLGLLASAPLAACGQMRTAELNPALPGNKDYDRWYIGSRPDGEHQLPLVDRSRISWKGVARVGRKAPWPSWNPTSTMVRLKIAPGGTYKAGVDNPLGARALYLYQGDRDILFRIHGTNEPWSIGEQVSSGCIRMLNEDIVDLYDRVPVGATVLVRRSGHGSV
jgi:lipoprotein-anchoring transpeptidase ErfK/SrfK